MERKLSIENETYAVEYLFYRWYVSFLLLCTGKYLVIVEYEENTYVRRFIGTLSNCIAATASTARQLDCRREQCSAHPDVDILARALIQMELRPTFFRLVVC